VDPRANECGQKKQVTSNFPRTLREIKPGTAPLVAQCLNKLGSSRPSAETQFRKSNFEIISTSSVQQTNQTLDISFAGFQSQLNSAPRDGK